MGERDELNFQVEKDHQKGHSGEGFVPDKVTSTKDHGK